MSLLKVLIGLPSVVHTRDICTPDTNLLEVGGNKGNIPDL